MALATFTPPFDPSVGMTRKYELKILECEFGDGYTQATADGVNHKRKIYDLTWDVLTDAQADAIVSFLESKGGFTPFYFNPPGESSPVKVTSKDWTVTFNRLGYRTVRATFRQSFNVTV